MTVSETMEHVFAATADPSWVFLVYGYDSLRESSVESRFAISNGFLGVRGARSTTRGGRWVIPARTYVAGLFDRSGADRVTGGLIPAADWLRVRILLPSGPLLHHPGDALSHRMTLDMRRGALLSEGRHLKAPDLGLQVHTSRFVSLSDRAIGLQLIQLNIEDGELNMTLEASFDGTELGLVIDRLGEDLGLWHTQHSGKRLAMTTAAALQVDGRDIPPTALGPLKSLWTWKSRPGQVVCFQRCVSIVRGDTNDPDPAKEALDKLNRAKELGWRCVVAAHEAAWISRWRCSDVEVDGDDYHGHVFWDTEIFLLPFYILTWPEAARALLMYRFHTLDGARAKAAGMGWRGASYAWESADTAAILIQVWR
jgi:trehalose/maltose hydrolase-like predicted phosphorylase